MEVYDGVQASNFVQGPTIPLASDLIIRFCSASAPGLSKRLANDRFFKETVQSVQCNGELMVFALGLG